MRNAAKVVLVAAIAALGRALPSQGVEGGEGKRPARSLPAPALEHAFAVNEPETVRDGRPYTPFYGYVISPHAVVARGTVFCAFQNAAGRPIAMAYGIGRKAWGGPVKASSLGLGRDAHGNPSLCIDAHGDLHIFYGCHGGRMRHTRSSRPYDIAAWQEQKSPTPRATYPQTMRLADGTVCLFYRAGGHTAPWSLRTSSDDCRTWSDAQRIIEMRLKPRDRLAAAYCHFFPGSHGKTIHCFWNHKDDNAARVRGNRKHPWRPLKYKGLHEAVYRYNVYYVRRDADGAWRNAAGDAVTLPISKAEADARCLVYDSGDEFAFLGCRQAVNAEDRPYFTFGTGVVDWARVKKPVVVPVRRKFAHVEAGKWRISDAMPGDWTPDVVRVLTARGLGADGGGAARGWFIHATRKLSEAHPFGAVFLYHDQTGYATRQGGPARVP